MCDETGRLTEAVAETMMALQTTPTPSEAAPPPPSEADGTESHTTELPYLAQLAGAASSVATSALNYLPLGGWGAVPNLPALLETLPVSDQEHIASILFNDQKNFRLWFAKSHGNEPVRGEHPQFWMTRLSFFTVQLRKKFKAGDIIAITVHNATTRQMIRQSDLTGEGRSVFIVNKGKDPSQWLSKRVRVPSLEAVHEGDEPRTIELNPEPDARLDVYYMALNAQGVATTRLFFGFTSRQLNAQPGTAAPLMMRAERLRSDVNDEYHVAWSKPFVVTARDFYNDRTRRTTTKLVGSTPQAAQVDSMATETSTPSQHSTPGAQSPPQLEPAAVEGSECEPPAKQMCVRE
ncbi:MAG: hypothetical protein CMB11_07820 [Euryarchaeota archaeon]|nr:hypothetical protein [Euryarchaeota archaeon]